ncbi:MAG: biopolymer transporter ExbD [Gammaproteobacteria bacterium]|nr:biopolymer transporter ExbD [Gammaproteobacteria bacterium]
MRRRRASKRHEVAELNVTAFMNLMVVLVPFLLITAVFSRLTILELNLPSDNAQTSPPSKGLNLELSITQGDISVADRNGLIRTYKKRKDGTFDMASLSDLLVKIKSRSGTTKDVRILLEKDVSYDTLVQVMDAARTAVVTIDGKSQRIDLFPSISLGEAG